jgi:streptomycin 6-kinase
MAFTIPCRLAESCRKTPERATWLAQLPSTIYDLEERWSLTIGSPFDGEGVSCAWVATATFPDGTPAVLKLSMPHMEGEDEIAGLRFWNGDPTVRVLEADNRVGAMVLERCEPGIALRSLPEPEQDPIIAKLLNRLWRPPVSAHRFRHLSALTAYWSEETLACADQWTDPGLVREGLELFKELPRTSPREMLLATDLHAGNVLQAKREPWLVIDPKPFVGDPAFDATQHLFNCEARLRSNPDETIRRFADLLGVEEARVRLWIFARSAAEPRDDWEDARLTELAQTLAP